jgi:cell division protein FtsZ
VIFGAVVDESMKDQIRITVVATGFDQTPSITHRVVRPQTTTTSRPIGKSTTNSSNSTSEESVTVTSKQTPIDPNNLELPSFLRRPR